MPRWGQLWDGDPIFTTNDAACINHFEGMVLQLRSYGFMVRLWWSRGRVAMRPPDYHLCVATFFT